MLQVGWLQSDLEFSVGCRWYDICVVKIIGGIKIDYQITGEGRVLLLLHGWALEMSKEKYRKLVGELAKKYKVVALDFPGFGGSSLPPKPWGVREYADLVASFVNALNLRVFGIVGHSFGGRVAIKIAANEIFKVEKIILIDSAGVERKSWRVKLIIFLTKIIPRWIKRRRQNGVMRESFKLVVGENLEGEMERIKIPTVLVWGENDRTTPMWQARIIKEKIKGSILRIVKGGDHGVPYRRTDEVAGLILKSLDANN